MSNFTIEFSGREHEQYKEYTIVDFLHFFADEEVKSRVHHVTNERGKVTFGAKKNCSGKNRTTTYYTHTGKVYSKKGMYFHFCLTEFVILFWA